MKGPPPGAACTMNSSAGGCSNRAHTVERPDKTQSVGEGLCALPRPNAPTSHQRAHTSQRPYIPPRAHTVERPYIPPRAHTVERPYKTAPPRAHTVERPYKTAPPRAHTVERPYILPHNPPLTYKENP